MSTADLDALLKLLSDDTKAMEAVGANFQRTFPKSDHFRLAATIWCVPAVACVGGCVGDVVGDGRGRAQQEWPASLCAHACACVRRLCRCHCHCLCLSLRACARAACACVRARLCVHAGDG